MKSQNKYGLIFFILAFASVITIFSFFIPKKSNTNTTNPTAVNEKQKPWEMDWSHTKLNSEELKPFHGKTDEELALENSQRYSNNDVSNTSNFENNPYTYTKPAQHDSSYYENESGKYIYHTQPTYITNSNPQTTDYHQELAPENTTRSSSYNDSYSAPMPQRQPSTITNCDTAGCWGSDGTRYNRGAGDTYFPSTGGVCQGVGGQMQCN